jgi:hypothetical protein
MCRVKKTRTPWLRARSSAFRTADRIAGPFFGNRELWFWAQEAGGL